MPIRHDLRIHYGRAWRREVRPRILERAGHCCEQCGKPDRQRVYTFTWRDAFGPHMCWMIEDGVFWKTEEGRPVWPRLRGLPLPVLVILTVAHVNHDATDNRDENLRALCQWCHLHMDAGHHRETRCARKDAARPLFGSLPA